MGAGLFVVCSTRSFSSFFRPATKKTKKRRRRKKNRYSASFPHLFSYLFSLCLFSFQARRFEFFPQWVFPPQALFFSPKAKVQRRKPGRNGRKFFFGATKLLHLAVVVRCHNCTSRENPNWFQRAPRRTMKTKTEKKPEAENSAVGGGHVNMSGKES